MTFSENYSLCKNKVPDRAHQEIIKLEIYSVLQQNIHKCLYKFQITASNFFTIRQYAFKSFPCSLKFLRRIFCIFCCSAEYNLCVPYQGQCFYMIFLLFNDGKSYFCREHISVYRHIELTSVCFCEALCDGKSETASFC